MIIEVPYRITTGNPEFDPINNHGTVTKYFGKSAIKYLENVKHQISCIGEEVLDDRNELGIVIGVIEKDGPLEGFYYHIFKPKTNDTYYSKTIKLV